MDLQDTDKVKALISLSNHAYEETKRYRDHVWKVLVWTIGLLVGVIATIKTTPNLTSTGLGKSLGSIFIFIVAVCGGWDIIFGYRQFVWNRNLVRDCERRLKFYDKNVYGDDTILPEGWKTAKYELKQCLPHLLQWLFIIVIVALYSLYVLIVS